MLALLPAACRSREPAPGAPATASASAAKPKSAVPDRRKNAARLAFVKGSTKKLQQLIGDKDFETGKPTTTLSEARFGVKGTDLGYSFEHEGKAYFLFGDTIGRGGGDAMAFTTSTSARAGISLEFVTGNDGNYLKVAPSGEKMGGFEVPVSGISLGGKMYVVQKTNHGDDKDHPSDISVLTRFADSRPRFEKLREISRLPDGRFSKMSLRSTPDGIEDLPSGGPFVLMWGTGVYRKSHPYLALVPVATFESGAGTKYFAGLDADRKPTWSTDEAKSAPLFRHDTLGDISVSWVESLRLFVMTYDSREPRGILLRYGETPWGPFSEPQLLFDPADGYGKFINSPDDPRDNLQGPVIGKDKDPKATKGGAYAPYVIERFTTVEGDRLALHYVLSTWNPYVVLLMRSELEVRR